MLIDDVRMRLRSLGAKAEHERLILRAWVHGLPLGAERQRPEGFYPARLCQALPALCDELRTLGRLRSEHAGAEGTARLLVELRDGKTVESVLLPRKALCVSTQVGCAVGCVFCMTGQGGLERQLGSAEIIAQVALARRLRDIRKVVFMGMGEPSHNLRNVLEAIEFLGTEGAIAHKQLVFSTVGDRRVFGQLGEGVVRPALALSLHSTRAEVRARLLPRAPRVDPDELVALAECYARATTYPVQYQWTLLEGINDNDEEIEGIIRLLSGKYAILNLIPYNPVPGARFQAPEGSRAAAIARRLHRQGVLTKLRRAVAQDVEGACGQLRANRA